MAATGACGSLLPKQTSESVLQRGKSSQRTATFVVPSLTTAAVGGAKFGADTTFNAAAKFNGNLEGVPLFVAGATPGKGMYIIASHGGGNSVLTAIDETTGVTLWSHNLGASGNGVRSTPVIDANGIVYTAIDASTGGAHFEVHASSIANMGTEVAGWPVNAANIKSGNGDMLANFDVGKEIQRGALSLVNGILYVPFGGVYGDGPPYKGFVVAINTATPTQTGAWSASGDRSGLWQGGGLASDGTSLFASTSNGSDGTHKDSEEVVRISGMGASSQPPKDVFFPSSWNTWDGQDNDFGASSPLVVSFSGACQAMVVSPSKPGHLFFMDPKNLGGADGSTALHELVVATKRRRPWTRVQGLLYRADRLHLHLGRPRRRRGPRRRQLSWRRRRRQAHVRQARHDHHAPHPLRRLVHRRHRRRGPPLADLHDDRRPQQRHRLVRLQQRPQRLRRRKGNLPLHRSRLR